MTEGLVAAVAFLTLMVLIVTFGLRRAVKVAAELQKEIDELKKEPP